MILDPKELDCVRGVSQEKQYQPNGVDVRIDKVMTLADDSVFTMSEREEDKISKQIKLNAETLEWERDEKGEYVILAPGMYYLFDTIEEVEVPEDASGMLKHRSSANRASMRIESGWWDSGYIGKMGGSITVAVPIKIYRGTRVAQLVLWKSQTSSSYNGQWQNSDSVGTEIK